ncbi:MAG: type II secretion system ATPase GspE [Candidatus Hydrogenedentota bacterium]
MLEVSNPELFLEILLKNNLITQENITEIKRQHQITGENVKTIIKRLEYCDDIQMLQGIADYYGMPAVRLADVQFNRELLKIAPIELVQMYKIAPFQQENNKIKVAIDDPNNFKGLDEFRLVVGMDIEPYLALNNELTEFIDKNYGASGTSIEDMLESIQEDALQLIEETGVTKDELEQAESAPIIKLVNLVFLQALKSRASDIHIEPKERSLEIRYRVDGILHKQVSPPKRLQGPIISRLKLMAGCDLAERRVPQDGRIKLRMLGKDIDLRFSALPSIHGESLVMRILDKAGLLLSLDQVGFLPHTIKKFEQLIARPNGIILVTGPTGSGKTTTLYAALNRLNTFDRKIITAEDPVEYQINGINQLQIHHDIGLDFARALRAMLRQAPDVILVGEIRDLETAEIAIRSALTGHLVFSTLHTNDAPSSITRLIDMGINPYLVASSVEAIMAQRLVRKICEKCKEPYEPSKLELQEMNVTREEVKDVTFYHGRGCEECNMSGYRGRTAIFELLVIDEDIREMILTNTPSNEIARYAREKKGMETLRDYGFLKVKRGETTIIEVKRITATDEA